MSRHKPVFQLTDKVKGKSGQVYEVITTGPHLEWKDYETMVFKMRDDGTTVYLDLWCAKTMQLGRAYTHQAEAIEWAQGQ